MAEHRRTCAACGTPNEEDARFCEGCGSSLARECATCGVEASATARFCRGCGAPLDGQVPQGIPAAGPVRKTVTVMFADLAGSTSFEEQVDAETAREVIGRYHDLLRSTAERHRAGLTKYIGDGFMAVWGVPEIGPDDAAHAVEAAVALQEHFVDLAALVTEIHGVELALRVAVNTGEVVVGAGDADLVGDALNVAARLEAECPRGRVVVGEETWRSTRGRHGYESLGEVQVKGRTAPVALYQWLTRRTESADTAPFVGRADEVRRLQAVLDDVVAARAARMVTVIGDPGVGKSRLSAEFTGAQGDARIIQVRCDVEGTVALAPIVEVLRSSDLETDIPPGVPERDRLLRDLNGLATGVPGSVEANFWALRRFVEVLASDHPVLLVLDDIQWADTLLLDFIEHLVEWVQEAPILLLALARPELREIRPDLVTVSRWVSEAIHLDGLDAGATAELAAKVLGATALPDELLHRLPSSTGGNPLFVRELIGMLAHDGVLVQEPDGWRLAIDVDAIAIPPTIHALLASRLERLDASDRRVLEVASVVGSDFSPGAVAALTGTSAPEIMLSLNRLRRLDLAQPSGAYLGDEPVWRFHHVLIRDVAYRRLLKSDRADLHERLADWEEAGGAGVTFESDEMIARHLEAAHSYRLELGTPTGDLALRSAQRYAASARRALDRDELVSAGTQAARGAVLAAADETIHAELLLIGCEAFLSAGDVAAGAPLVDELDAIAGDALAPWATCYRCQFVVLTAPERLPEVDARLQSAIDEFARRNDPAGLAKAHRVRAGTRARLGRIGDCEADLFEALIAARNSGDHRQITAALGAAPGAALWGPSPVPKAGGRCLDVVRMQRMTTAAPSLEATSLRCLAVLEMLRGRPDKARAMLADARKVVAELGLRHGLMETELFAGIIESMEGDLVAAEPHFRSALEGLDALGVGADAGQAAALLARSVLAQGHIDEADRYATESEHLAGRNLKTAIAWRAVRAEILTAQRRFDEATAMAREAVAVAAGTDLVLDHAEACLALSRVLAAAGDTKGANVARADAEALYAAKEVASAVGRTAEAAPPPAVTVSTTSRLAVTNRATAAFASVLIPMRANDVDAVLAHFSDHDALDDRRRLSGVPVDDFRAGTAQLLQQFNHFEGRPLAVRGEHHALMWGRWSDDSGNETPHLHVLEVDDDGRFTYEGRFDEDDFEGAYDELERRYYAKEGAAFAEAGAMVTDWVTAMNRGDFNRVFGELSTPDLRVANRSRSALPDLSAEELRTSFEDLDARVASTRTVLSALCWVSPAVIVGRFEREATGHDGEQYSWSRLFVNEIRDRRLVSVCQFEIDDEEAAFAYAEECVRASTSRLAVRNRASERVEALANAMGAADGDAAVACYAEPIVYDDRRRISGDPVRNLADMRAAVERIFQQYNRFEVRPLAVRGERLHLFQNRWSNDAGYETTYLHLDEIGDDGLIHYEARFDEDDFDGAYRELERRYYAREGAAFADSGVIATEWIIALNHGDFDRLFGDLTDPDMRVVSRSRSVFVDRSAAEVRGGFEELEALVSWSRSWHSALCWVSPNIVVLRFEREAVGLDGEEYTWTWLHISEIRDRRVAAACRFEIDDEDAAFAYAEERVRATTSRLAVANSASRAVDAVLRAVQAHDVDAAIAAASEAFEYADYRRLSGDQIVGLSALRLALTRLVEQYPHVASTTLAVRGERLEMRRSRWWDDDGNEATYLTVCEVDNAGRLEYQGRFDEGDFESAYRELERRYYAGEGAAFAEEGALGTEWVCALNKGDFDRVFNELTHPDMHVENRSMSVFGDPSAGELRATFEELYAMVASARAWSSALCWLSPAWGVARFEREAVGHDGEKYAWSRIQVIEIRDGRLASICRFEVDDEDAAFAFAEERLRASFSRLAVANRASRTVDISTRAMQTHDVNASVAAYADHFVYDDRRQLGGDPIQGTAELREASVRILEQYPHVEWRVLAIRGEALDLRWSRWWDDAGNEATYLSVCEVDVDGRIDYHGRFDGDDFDAAYRELERRYYAGEGAEFAEAGTTATDYVIAINSGDFDRVFGELSAANLRFEDRTRSGFGDRSVAETRASLEKLATMVASSQTWNSAIRWLSPTLAVIRAEREIIGRDGEKYRWNWLGVSEILGGQLMSMCRFEPDDEDAAFSFAEDRLRASSSRLAVTNHSCDYLPTFVGAAHDHDVDSALAWYADRMVYDDHRRLSGDPVVGRDAMRAAIQRVFDQYTKFETRVLAVRGERLHLLWSRWSDDDGNVTTSLYVDQIGDDGLVEYHGRFDEGDFEGAYRELERRYYAGEGLAFAAAGTISTEWVIAANRGDFDRVFDELSTADLHVENRSRSPLPNHRSAAEFRTSIEELNAMVATTRTWLSAMCWLAPTVVAGRFEREAIGHDGEHFTWTRLYVNEVRDGRLTSMCEFEPEDEDAAFAYAEERVRAAANRLALTNRASKTQERFLTVMRAKDMDGVLAYFADEFEYDDRRRLTGDPIHGPSELRTAFERIFAQYNHFDYRSLALRGERLHLFWGRWANDAGYETAYLFVREIGDDERVIYEGRFDEDDFVGAYSDLEQRYYAGEGAAFAEGGATATEFFAAENRGDLDRAFSELTSADFRVENRSSSAFGDRSAAEFRASREELGSMVESVRSWHSAIRWLTPTSVVGRFEREAVGRDGERYTWSLITAIEIRDGRLASTCMFELDDEAAAFAYAEERARAATSRLAVTNLASQAWDALGAAMDAHDVEGMSVWFGEGFVYDDRRRMGGSPLDDLRSAMGRIFAHYTRFERRSLAVRGQRLHLGWTRWSNDDGFETTYLFVHQVRADGRFIYHGCFDDDDFEEAYRELESRYYSGEGAAFADSASTSIEYVTALGRGDLDRMFGELTAADFCVENRSRSAFPDRSAAELRASAEELLAMVSSIRTWHSAVYWVSPAICVARDEREAVGRDGEQYSWTRLHVGETRDGQVASACVFDIDDEEAAFAYAEERARAAASRLAVTNLATQRFDASARAARDNDVDAMVACYAESFTYDDRRRLSGRPLDDLRTACERILAQYNQFEGRTLAVRGERLHLSSTRWSNESGFETSYFIVHEVDESGLFIYEGRFDGQDFDGAYRELEHRYYAGEGASFAQAGAVQTEWLLALNRRDLDRLFGELTATELRFEVQSSSAFPDSSTAEGRAAIEDFNRMFASAQTWLSAICWVSPTCCASRYEREAVGHDGAQYAWTRLTVAEFRDGQMASEREFEPDDEAAAFAYAEERVNVEP